MLIKLPIRRGKNIILGICKNKRFLTLIRIRFYKTLKNHKKKQLNTFRLGIVYIIILYTLKFKYLWDLICFYAEQYFNYIMFNGYLLEH